MTQAVKYGHKKQEKKSFSTTVLPPPSSCSSKSWSHFEMGSADDMVLGVEPFVEELFIGAGREERQGDVGAGDAFPDASSRPGSTAVRKRALKYAQNKTRSPTDRAADRALRSDTGPSLEAQLAALLLKYMDGTSLHGLKYITETKRSAVERIFWIATIVFAWAFGGYMIYQVIHKWKTSPVLVSFDSVQTGIYQIPFPSLTVCNMNKVRKSKVEHIEEALLADPDSSYYQTEKRFVEEICAKHEDVASGHGHGDSSDGHEADGHSSDGHGGDVVNLELTGEQLHHYLADLALPCEEMLLRCHFEGRFFDCSDLFIPTITDEGQCCSFNIMPETVMYRKEVLQVPYDEDEAARWVNWNMQDGYLKDPNVHDIHDVTKDMPLRALAPGLHMGLSMVLDVKEKEYYCSGTESIGFKVLLHTPVSQPEMIEYGFAVSPGNEAFLAVAPEIIHADESIHGITYDKRGCYLSDERELAYFSYYSHLNCFMECSSNYTFKQCGCVAYYMPRDADTMPICAPELSTCVDEAVMVVEESAYNDNHESNRECRCLPSCTDMEFPHETSVSSVKSAEMLSLNQELIANVPEYSNDTYVQNNLAIMHVYFKHLYFMKQERGELFGFVDLFSNVGGLLGLCMGFSALSAVELLYFFSMRLWYNFMTPRKEDL